MTHHWLRDLAIHDYILWHNERMPEPRTPVTYEEVAEAFGLTKGRISQIYTSSESGRVEEHETIRVGGAIRYMIHNDIGLKPFTLAELADFLRDVEPW